MLGRFQQCLRPFSMFTILGFSEMALGNTYAIRLMLFFKMFKIKCIFKKSSQKIRKVF